MRNLSKHSGAIGDQLLCGTTRTLDYTHQGTTVLFDKLDGCNVTLPRSKGDFGVYRFMCAVTATGGSNLIKVGNATDVMAGQIVMISQSSTINGFPTTATQDTLTMNRTTTGVTAPGDWIEFVDIAVGTFSVRGVLTGTGAQATPFSATV